MSRAPLSILSLIFTQAAIFGVMCYQAMIRPFLLGSCKYHPSCSEYAIEALRSHGLVRGSLLALARLVRCHPFARGGYDPVPPARCQAG